VDFSDQIQALSAKLAKQFDHLDTEEATKNALVMPFISALGYNVFDPTEVVPEYTADVGTKKGEKVDYAILSDGKPIILVECKWCGANLEDAHKAQLYRYFTVTDARIGILTNGVVYQFYTDLDKPNRMDEKPFLVFDLQDVREPQIEELKRLSKHAFDEEAIVSAAGELKYTRQVRRMLSREFSAPREEFIRFVISKVYSGNITAKVREEFTPIVKRGLRQFLNEQVNARLRTAIESEAQTLTGNGADLTAPEADKPEIVTTEEELEAYMIVKAILRQAVDPERVTMKDRLSYCTIVLDDNSRQPICRLHFNSAQKYLGLLDENKKETRHALADLNDIFDHADELQRTVAYYGG